MGFQSYHGQIKRGLSLTMDISSGVSVLPRTDQLGLSLATDISSGV